MEPSDSRKSLWIDLGFTMALAIWAALWLIVFTNTEWAHTWPGFGFFAVVFVILVFVWKKKARTWDAEVTMASAQQGAAGSSSKVRGLLSVAALVALVWVSYFEPLKLHFWGGFDDFYSLEKYPLWNPKADEVLGRPLNSIFCQFAVWLTPNSVLGSLWMACALNFLNALLIYGIVRKMAPQVALCAWGAALLYAINSGDESRFYPLWTTNFYWAPLMLILAGIWLFLVSEERRSRPLLVLSCVLAGCAFLISEGTFPLSLLGPVLLWIRTLNFRRIATWIFAWIATEGIFAGRLVFHLLTAKKKTYQANMAAGAMHDPTILVRALGSHLKAVLRNFTFSGDTAAWWAYGLAALVLSLGILVSVRRPVEERMASWRQLFIGAGLGAAAFLLGVLPFVHLDSMTRTHFLASAGEGVFLAFGFGMVARLLGPRLGVWLMRVGIAALVGMATAQAFVGQISRAQSSPVSFEKLTHVMQQVHSLAPNIPEDVTPIFQVEDEWSNNPLGTCYSTAFIARLVWGHWGLQLSSRYQQPDWELLMTPQEIALRNGKAKTTYDKAVVFRCALDGSVYFCSKFPQERLPAGMTISNYQPLALLSPGRITPTPFFQYPSWTTKLMDVFETEKGIMLGDGWLPLKFRGARPFREVRQDAELVINPAGHDQYHLSCMAEPPENPRGEWKLQVLDAAGTELGSGILKERDSVRMVLPLDVKRLNVLKLRMVPLHGEAFDPKATFLVYRAGKKTDFPPR